MIKTKDKERKCYQHNEWQDEMNNGKNTIKQYRKNTRKNRKGKTWKTKEGKKPNMPITKSRQKGKYEEEEKKENSDAK